MALENFTLKENIPKDFEAFLVFFENWISGQKNSMKAFLGLNYEVKVLIEKEAKTFAFSPSTKKIIIPLSFLKNFHEKLTQTGKINEASKFIHTFEDLKFGLYHELSHFRDMMNEKDRKKRGAMIDILKYVGDQKIKFGTDKTIPIGQSMHSIVNCIDDIIVNTEVEMYIGTGIDKIHLKGFYMYNLFADKKEKLGGGYILVDERLKYVGVPNGTHEINDSKEVDYSKTPLSQAFPYFLLRSFMVPTQQIKLPEKVETLLFSNEKRTSRLSYKRSIKKMVENMNTYFVELEKKGDEKIQERLKQLRGEYLSTIQSLEKILSDQKLAGLLSQSIKMTQTNHIYTADTINLLDIIKLFLLSTGKENTHSLDVSPGLRYEIYKALFLPIQKGFILMDVLTQNIKDNNSKGKGKGESEGKGEGNDKNRDSGITALHESPDRDEKIKLLEDLAKEDESQKAEVLIKKQKEISKYDVENILESSGVSQVGIDTLNYIVRNYNEWIKEIVDFFLQELKKLDTLEIRNQFDAKKGKLDTHKVRKYVASDPTLGDIEKQKFYDKTEHIEKISEMLKKIDLTLAIDVSGSTNSFRGKDGMMNIISTILFIAMKHLEQHMKNMINDGNYTIPVHFVLYGDGNPYSSHSSVHKNDTDEVKMAEMNEKILTLDGGTNDTTAWQKISYEFGNFLKSNPEYVSEIKNQKRKPIILQIADSDVSENGVDILKETFSTYLQNDEIVNKIPIKRMILGNVSFDEITTEEYLERQKTGSLGNWEPLHLPNGKIQLKQVGVKQKKEIVGQIKALFANFFDDINYK